MNTTHRFRRFGFVLMVTVLSALPSPAADVAPTRGPLRVGPRNARYFHDATGQAVLLVGSHTWDSLQDMTSDERPTPFDWPAYLDFLSKHNHNFIRLWRWELLSWDTTANKPAKPRHLVVSPHPWARTGPGQALDGNPRFDLGRFDEAYFTRLRERVAAARDRGVYVSVMLFEGWGLQHAAGAWKAHPFHPSNNINGLDGDINHDGVGTETQTMNVPAALRVQEAYVRKVIATVHDLDNVLYEIVNESGSDSVPWQYHMIQFVKDEEKARGASHPVGMTFPYSRDATRKGNNAQLFEGPADWVSPNPDASPFNYRTDPPPATGTKVVLTDTDHLWGIGGNGGWVWKSVLRGLNPLFMDPYQGQVLDEGGATDWLGPVRSSLGQALRWSRRVDLNAMAPSLDVASTRYCLASPGRAYLIYLPDEPKVTVDLSGRPGGFEVEWFDPRSETTRASDPIQGGSRVELTSPFAPGGALLHLRRAEN
jgi:hypothetical protein